MYKHITILLYLSSVLIIFGGCASRFVFIQEARFSRLAISAEDLAFLRKGKVQFKGGRLVSTDKGALNSQLGKITIRKTDGKNPMLYIDGRTKPFAEVLSKEGKIKLIDYDLEFFPENTFFTVEKNNVRVWQNLNASGDKTVIKSLKQGDIVVKLAEYDKGWYKIKIINDGIETVGFAEALDFVPLLLLTNESNLGKVSDTLSIYKNKSFQRNNYLETSVSYLDTTNEEIHITLKFQNVYRQAKELAIAFNSKRYVPFADYWKFFPEAVAELTDENLKVYGLSEVTGLGFARDSDDWTILQPKEYAFVNMVFKKPEAHFFGKDLKLNIEIKLVCVDENLIKRHKTITIQLNCLLI